MGDPEERIGIILPAPEGPGRAGRIWTLLKKINVREGHGRKEDSLPDRWFEEPGFRHYVTGNPLSRREAEIMVEEYYDERGWDPVTGIPPD